MEENKNILLYLNRNKHRELKVIAAKEDTSVSKIIRELIDKYIKEYNEQNKG